MLKCKIFGHKWYWIFFDSHGNCKRCGLRGDPLPQGIFLQTALQEIRRLYYENKTTIKQFEESKLTWIKALEQAHKKFDKLQEDWTKLNGFKEKFVHFHESAQHFDNLCTLIEAHRKWSDSTFGLGRSPVGPLKHLQQEAKEARKATPEEFPSEMADCFLLVLESMHLGGMNFKQLVDASFTKLAINTKRTYVKPVGDNPSHHKVWQCPKHGFTMNQGDPCPSCV